ncbi:MAG: hypothetical protein AAFZ09_10230, partial [Pseudomonadota bacterium]
MTRLHVEGLDRWDADLDVADFRIRLLTDTPDGRTTPATAELSSSALAAEAGVRLERRPEGTGTRTTLAYGGETPPAGIALLTADYARAGGGGGQAVAAGPIGLREVALARHGAGGTQVRPGELTPVGLFFPATELAAAHGGRLAARGLLDPGVTRAPWLYLPTARGVAQLAVPEEDPELRDRGTADPAGAAIAGGVFLRWTPGPLDGPEPATMAPVTFDIQAAGWARVSASWSDGTPREVQIALGEPVGTVGGVAWAIVRSPSASDALPTGRDAPAATEPVALHLGGRYRSNAALSLSLERGAADVGTRSDAVLTIDPYFGLAPDVTAEPMAGILWETRGREPLIAATDMLRQSPSATVPSATRGLVPAAFAGALTLEGRLEAGELRARRPADLLASHWPWPDMDKGATWSGPAVALVSPTAPGLEYAYAAGGEFEVVRQDDGDGGQREPLDVPPASALRYDLPILDDLFAAARPPAPARPAGPRGKPSARSCAERGHRRGPDRSRPAARGTDAAPGRAAAQFR